MVTKVAGVFSRLLGRVGAQDGVVRTVRGGAGSCEAAAVAWRTRSVDSYGVLLLVRGQCLESVAAGAGTRGLG